MREAGTWDESAQTVTDTICPYCGVGCAVDAPRPGRPDRQGHLAARLVGDRRPPVHQGPLRLRVRQQPPRQVAPRAEVSSARPVAWRMRRHELAVGAAAAPEVVRRLSGDAGAGRLVGRARDPLRSEAVEPGDVDRGARPGATRQAGRCAGRSDLLTTGGRRRSRPVGVAPTGRSWESARRQRYFGMDPAADGRFRDAVRDALDGRTPHPRAS